MSETTTTLPGGRCPLPHARPCPNWCVECDHQAAPDGPVVHRGRAFKVPVLVQQPTDLIVRAWHADIDPVESGIDPASVLPPTIYLSGEHIHDLDLTPEQSQTLIAALTAITADLRTG